MINLDRNPSKATIAWIAAADPHPGLAEAANAAGYRLTSPPGGLRVDIAAVDLRGVENPETAGALVARARRLAPAGGVILIASHATALDRRFQPGRATEVCCLQDDPAPLLIAIRERLRLAALVDEMGERVKSLLADGRKVSFQAPALDRAELSVLVAGAPSPVTLNVCNAVRGAKARPTCVFSAGQVMRALDHRRFDAAIFLPSNTNDLLLALARALRRHRDHRRLPVILSAADEELLCGWAARDGFAAIAARDLEAFLAPRLEAAVRRGAFAAALRSYLRSPEGSSGKHGLASARFFAHHAVRVFRRADETGQPISFVGLSLVAAASSSRDAVPPSLVNVARTVASLVRAEDLAAKLSSDTLVVLLRGARQGESERVAARIEGVAAGASLRSRSDVARVIAGGVERRPGDGIETTIANLFRSLRDSRAAAAL